MTKTRKIVSVAIAFLLLLSVIGMVLGSGISAAYAASDTYSNVMTDLHKDSNFKEADYPYKSGDYSLQVIQIAESDKGELFIYVNQSNGVSEGLCATEINMSLSESADGTKLYGLTLLNVSGVFAKYKVNDLTVSQDWTRYYNITSIYRKWGNGIDKETGNDNTKNGVSYAVGKLYKATTENGMVSYTCREKETVTIIDKYVGFLRYQDGFKLWGQSTDCDSHYIAFSTDRKIDDLREADVYFVVRNATSESMTSGILGGWTYGTPEEKYVTLNYTDLAESGTGGWFAENHKWKRIERSTDFVKNEDLKDEAKSVVSNKQWVLRFYESGYNHGSHVNNAVSRTDVSSVTILRLKFVTDGKIYNLGVIDDKQTGSDMPTGGGQGKTESKSFWENLWEAIVDFFTGKSSWWVYLVFGLVLLAVGLPLLSVFIPAVGSLLMTVGKAIGKALVWLLKGIWWLICLPFKGIAALIKKIQDKKGGA